MTVRAVLSVKNTFSAFPLGFLSSNLGKVIDEQGERFHQDISVIEE